MWLGGGRGDASSYEESMGQAVADALASAPHPLAFSPQLSGNPAIAQIFFFPALSSSYLCASAIEVAVGPRGVVSTTADVSVRSRGRLWAEVRSPTSTPLHFAPETFQKNQVSQREWRTLSALRNH